MPATELDLFQDRQRSNWVRLRTLVVLRWFAIAGQVGAIAVATLVYDLQIQTLAAVLTIAASILVNLSFSFLYPENRRLSEREASSILGFDILQLSILLFLTGGLSNPFAVLMLAPVTIAATVLHLSSTLVLGGAAIAVISFLSQVNIPIQNADGIVVALPALFLFGFWVALVIAIVFLAIYARQVTTETQSMGDALLATQLALAREQKLTDLGGVVAATAHELGTPLATIKLVSGELIEDLSDNPDALEDMQLIREQADRCRDILRSMGRAGKDDLHLHSAPFETVVKEAADPHLERGKQILFDVGPVTGVEQTQPTILRRPEIIHGLRNLIQNAVDFANAQVEIDVTWSDQDLHLRISDDGPGFPSSVLGRIGDPFVGRKRGRRPGYEGMGLGLFIAKTLLERSGARLTFTNGRHLAPDDSLAGAIVTVTWPRTRVEQGTQGQAAPLGENQPIIG